jgi:arylsulfatase A-like enzyme
MLPALRGQVKGPLHEILFWDDGAGLWAVRAEKWKLVSVKGTLELYDLSADVGEKNDVLKRNPDIVERLERDYRAWKGTMAPRIQKVRGDQAAPAAPKRTDRKKTRKKR